MNDVEFKLCTRNNTCYKCDNKECWHCGDIEADCIIYECFRPDDMNCHNCEYNQNYRE